MGLGYVPVDEGEAEAQPDLPPVTITLVHEGGQQAPWPWTVRFTVPAGGSLRKGALADYLADCARRWAAAMDYAMVDGEARWDTDDTGKVLAITATITGYRS